MLGNVQGGGGAFRAPAGRGLCMAEVKKINKIFIKIPISIFFCIQFSNVTCNIAGNKKHFNLKVECLLTLAIWSYGHEAEEYIFLNLPFPSNPKENSSMPCILSTPEQNLLWRIIGCTPNTFHNTINKNVNHSNDTIDNLNQSSFHKPACQCQGHLRTESLPASVHILHCGVKYDLGWCGLASALKIVCQLIFDNHVTFV